MIDKFAGVIKHSQRILIFTGAGISTESGISDYRSKGGLWNRFQPITIQEFMDSVEKRAEYWSRKLELYESMKMAKPNDGHLAIVDIEKLNKLKGIVTQNIDGLHQLAGSSPDKILELHGSNRETLCLQCGDLQPWPEVYERLKNGETAPECLLCNGPLKPNTISFGQSLDQNVLNMSLSWAKECDCVLAIGSTLVVEPAASIPRIAKQNGAKFVILTLSQTPLDNWADLKISENISQSLKSTLATFLDGEKK